MKTVFKEPNENMEMPTPCQHCGNWFDLNDGVGSEKWHPNTVICEECADLEEKEMDRDDLIRSLKAELADAEWTVENCRKRLKELSVPECEYLNTNNNQ